MLAVRLDPQMEAELNRLATATGRSKSFYGRRPWRPYLEDRVDYLLALAALERDEPRTDFVVYAVQEPAQRAIEQGAVVRLSPAESERFAQRL